MTFIIRTERRERGRERERIQEKEGNGKKKERERKEKCFRNKDIAKLIDMNLDILVLM